MAFERVCSLDDVWEGEMQSFPVGDKEVLVVNGEGGVVRVFDAICPHQEYPLAEGTLEGSVLTCSMHLWQFDIGTGEGLNPTGCKLKTYAMKIEDNDVLVDLEASA